MTLDGSLVNPTLVRIDKFESHDILETQAVSSIMKKTYESLPYGYGLCMPV